MAKLEELTCSPSSAIGSLEFTRAYQKGFVATLRFLRSLGANLDLAEEVAQAAWARGWQYREQLKQPDLVGAWVNSIARNLYRSVIVRELRFRELEDSAAPCTLSCSLEAEAMLSVCTETESKMLKLFYVEGYTAMEIAAKEGMCPTTVRVRLMRIRRSLRERLAVFQPEEVGLQAA